MLIFRGVRVLLNQLGFHGIYHWLCCHCSFFEKTCAEALVTCSKGGSSQIFHANMSRDTQKFEERRSGEKIRRTIFPPKKSADIDISAYNTILFLMEN